MQKECTKVPQDARSSGNPGMAVMQKCTVELWKHLGTGHKKVHNKESMICWDHRELRVQASLAYSGVLRSQEGRCAIVSRSTGVLKSEKGKGVRVSGCTGVLKSEKGKGARVSGSTGVLKSEKGRGARVSRSTGTLQCTE